jgi:hypothetical protein
MPESGDEATETVRKIFADYSAFQRSRADLPQGDITRLSTADMTKVVQAHEIEQARKQGAEMVEIVERRHRSGYVSSAPVRSNKKKSTDQAI